MESIPAASEGPEGPASSEAAIKYHHTEETKKQKIAFQYSCKTRNLYLERFGQRCINWRDIPHGKQFYLTAQEL